MTAFHGALAYHDTTASWADQDVKKFPFNSTELDTDGYHFTSAANLTGTVSKTSASATITGSGTAFTTELSVNQAIAIPGTETQIFVVQSIESDTSLTAWQTAAASASGQTAARRNDVLAVPAGQAGYYACAGGAYVAGDPAQDAPFYILKNGPGSDGTGGAFPTGGVAAIIRGAQFTPYTAQPAAVGGIGHVHAHAVQLAEGDYIQVWLYLDNDGGGGSFTIGNVTSPGAMMWAGMYLIGT